ncbi:hypothetical protein PLICRDRAFT_179940 [Plicaturopsis crispa FD-325 SS-3]|uniref:NAD-dependent epimerase/dehydratase domain-containing protein n=1 Tax=Plicaturopsis crispa FD-325 SS-3 TaxID=944288 RepID=A0A0C9SWS8_PLICR|nr:hypothetical protein PLICRDRAFT_179940 [Plicaturopsis crispa FD-325 SS-3]
MTVIPNGSTVLVTGFTGYIGSHVTQQLLEAGYTGRLEVLEIPDVTVEGALDEAIKGVSGVAHVASDVSMSPNVDEVWMTEACNCKGLQYAKPRYSAYKSAIKQKPILTNSTMTVIPNGSTVLVTGFTGYIGSHVTQQLLEAGYTVRGTTRSATKATFLREKFTRDVTLASAGVR